MILPRGSSNVKYITRFPLLLLRLGWCRGRNHRLYQEQARTDDEAAIGDVEDGPFDFVEVQEIADALEDDAVVEVADGATEDQAERDAEPAVVRRAAAGAPDQNRECGEHADARENVVRQFLVVPADAEQRALIHARHHRGAPGLEAARAAIAQWRGRVEFRGEFEPTGYEVVLAALVGPRAKRAAFFGPPAVVQPAKHAVLRRLIGSEAEQRQTEKQPAVGTLSLHPSLRDRDRRLRTIRTFYVFDIVAGEVRHNPERLTQRRSSLGFWVFY